MLNSVYPKPYALDGVPCGSASASAPLRTYRWRQRSTTHQEGDLALYEAKAAGRGTYRQFERSMQTEVENRLKLEHDLRQALPLNQLRVYYQPLVDSESHEVMGFEALLRWQHPVRGFVSPADFVRSRRKWA